MDLIFATVESHAPNSRASILGHSAPSPIGLEEKLGLAGDDIFHGALTHDQLWAARPMLGYGDCRTPVKACICAVQVHIPAAESPASRATMPHAKCFVTASVLLEA